MARPFIVVEGRTLPLHPTAITCSSFSGPDLIPPLISGDIDPTMAADSEVTIGNEEEVLSKFSYLPIDQQTTISKCIEAMQSLARQCVDVLNGAITVSQLLSHAGWSISPETILMRHQRRALNYHVLAMIGEKDKVPSTIQVGTKEDNYSKAIYKLLRQDEPLRQQYIMLADWGRERLRAIKAGLPLPEFPEGCHLSQSTVRECETRTSLAEVQMCYMDDIKELSMEMRKCGIHSMVFCVPTGDTNVESLWHASEGVAQQYEEALTRRKFGPSLFQEIIKGPDALQRLQAEQTVQVEQTQPPSRIERAKGKKKNHTDRTALRRVMSQRISDLICRFISHAWMGRAN